MTDIDPIPSDNHPQADLLQQAGGDKVPSVDAAAEAHRQLLLAGINLDVARRALNQGGAAEAIVPLIGALGTLQRDDLCYLLKLRRPALSDLLRPHLEAKTISEAPESKEERGSRRGPQAYWLFLAQSELPAPDRRRQIRALLPNAKIVLEHIHDDTSTPAEESEAYIASHSDPSPAESSTVGLEEQAAVPPVPQFFEQLEMTLLQELTDESDVAAPPAQQTSTPAPMPKQEFLPISCQNPATSQLLTRRKTRLHRLPPWTPAWKFAAHKDVYRHYNRYQAAGEVFQRATVIGVILLSLCLWLAPGLAGLMLFCLGAVLSVVGLLYLDAWTRARLAARAFTRDARQ